MMGRVCILFPLLLFLSPVCGRLWNSSLFPYTNKKHWTDAQAFCRKHHTDLVTVRNEQENAMLGLWGWIGLHRENAASPWKWSREDETATFTMWDDYEPKPDGDCVYRHPLKWRTSNCDEKRLFMCYDERLVLVKESRTWEEALDHCRSLGRADTDPASPYWDRRYDLATLVTLENHTSAREMAQEATTDEVWTGLHYLAGEWLWAGGERVQYEDVPRCPADGFCGVLEKMGSSSYSIRNCQRRRNFICYRKS